MRLHPNIGKQAMAEVSNESLKSADQSPCQRILVVDDDCDVRETLRTMFDCRGYQTSLACDGGEGLVQAERDNPNLIILDVMMPRRSGFVVLERIHTWPGNRPHVIMVSAHDDPRFRAFATAYGAAAFLTKPFKLEVLLAEVDRLLAPPQSVDPIPFAARFAVADPNAEVASELVAKAE